MFNTSKASFNSEFRNKDKWVHLQSHQVEQHISLLKAEGYSQYSLIPEVISLIREYSERLIIYFVLLSIPYQGDGILLIKDQSPPAHAWWQRDSSDNSNTLASRIDINYLFFNKCTSITNWHYQAKYLLFYNISIQVSLHALFDYSTEYLLQLNPPAVTIHWESSGWKNLHGVF